MKKTHILLADDYSIIRMAVRRLIENIIPGAVVEEAETFNDVQKFTNNGQFSLILLDTPMVKSNEKNVTDFLAEKNPETKVLIFSAKNKNLYAIRYLKAGADGFLEKRSSLTKIENAIKHILSTGQYIDSDLNDELIELALHSSEFDFNPMYNLSDRELEISSLLIRGLSVKEISNKLYIHISTASTYKRRVFDKLSVSNVIELAKIFRFYNMM